MTTPRVLRSLETARQLILVDVDLKFPDVAFNHLAVIECDVVGTLMA